MGTVTAIGVEELDAQVVELLPTRETLFDVNITNVVAVNLALAVNAASIGAVANAAAGQQIWALQQ